MKQKDKWHHHHHHYHHHHHHRRSDFIPLMRSVCMCPIWTVKEDDSDLKHSRPPTTMWIPRLWFVWRNLKPPHHPSVLSCPFWFMWHPRRFSKSSATSWNWIEWLFYPLQILVKMDIRMAGVQWLQGYTCHGFCNLSGLLSPQRRLPWCLRFAALICYPFLNQSPAWSLPCTKRTITRKYDIFQQKDCKLKEAFGEFMDKCLERIEREKLKAWSRLFGFARG